MEKNRLGCAGKERRGEEMGLEGDGWTDGYDGRRTQFFESAHQANNEIFSQAGVAFLSSSWSEALLPP